MPRTPAEIATALFGPDDGSSLELMRKPVPMTPALAMAHSIIFARLAESNQIPNYINEEIERAVPPITLTHNSDEDSTPVEP